MLLHAEPRATTYMLYPLAQKRAPGSPCIFLTMLVSSCQYTLQFCSRPGRHRRRINHDMPSLSKPRRGRREVLPILRIQRAVATTPGKCDATTAIAVSAARPVRVPPPQGQGNRASIARQGEYEQYANSMFGNTVPKAELHNPKGPIKIADMTITIDGELVPVVDIMLGNQLPIYFEHHILLWKHPGVQIGFRSMKGVAKRMSSLACRFF